MLNVTAGHIQAESAVNQKVNFQTNVPSGIRIHDYGRKSPYCIKGYGSVWSLGTEKKLLHCSEHIHIFISLA